MFKIWKLKVHEKHKYPQQPKITHQANKI